MVALGTGGTEGGQSDVKRLKRTMLQAKSCPSGCVERATVLALLCVLGGALYLIMSMANIEQSHLDERSRLFICACVVRESGGYT